MIVPTITMLRIIVHCLITLDLCEIVHERQLPHPSNNLNAAPKQATGFVQMIYSLKGAGRRFLDGHRQRWAFRNLSAEIANGQFVVVWGPSGSGKTTLLRLLAGLDSASEGQVLMRCKEQMLDLACLPEPDRLALRRERIGFVYQLFNLLPNLTVSENVELPLVLSRRQHLKDTAIELLATLGLGDRLKSFPRALSGGEQQRVSIVRALAHRPEVVLADEPTGNLDTSTAELIADLLATLTHERGATLIVATHNDRLKERADQVIEMTRRNPEDSSCQENVPSYMSV